jgi:4-amino-4-deoxy-L-arabinose transferase-like glycosyltransferase
MNQLRTSCCWSAALLCGLLLRLLFLYHRPIFSGDALIYGDLAHNMIAHHLFGFSENPLRSTLIRLPGYPLFLAACFLIFGAGNYVAVLWVQILVDLLSCVLMARLALRLGGSRCGLAVIWLAAMCPFTANYSIMVLTETLSIFCVVASFFSLERWDAEWRTGKRSLGWALATGAALAFAVLLRPDQGLLAASIIPAMVWVSFTRGNWSVGKRLRPVAVASVAILLPLLVWTGRNWKTFHVIQPLVPRYANDAGEFVPLGFQRWYRTWAIEYKSTFDVYWNYDDNVLALSDLPPRAFDNAEQRAQTQAVYSQYNGVTTATPEFDRQFNAIAAERIADHPVRYYVLLPVARLLNMWLRPRTEWMKQPLDWWVVRAHPLQSGEAIAYGLLNAAYLALAVVGFVRWKVRRWTGRGAIVVAMLAFVMLRCALLLTIDNSEPRYTLECFPIVILLAGFTFAEKSARVSD